MHAIKKATIIVAIALLLFFAGQVAAQTTVLGVILGKTTYNKAIAKLPETVQIETVAKVFVWPHALSYVIDIIANIRMLFKDQ